MYYKVHPFEVYNSMYIYELCNHPHNMILEHFYHTKKKALICSSSLTSRPHPYLTPLPALDNQWSTV